MPGALLEASRPPPAGREGHGRGGRARERQIAADPLEKRLSPEPSAR
jgi:hypothetical protein